MVHTVRGFGIVNKAELDDFLVFFCFFYVPTNVGNLLSCSSAFSKSSLNIWKFSLHILLEPHLENFEHDFASMWNEPNYAVIWTFFGIHLLWDWNENWPFPVLWPLLNFPNLVAYWVQHLTASSFSFLNSLAEIPSLPLALFAVILPKVHLTSHSRICGSSWVTFFGTVLLCILATSP